MLKSTNKMLNCCPETVKSLLQTLNVNEVDLVRKVFRPPRHYPTRGSPALSGEAFVCLAQFPGRMAPSGPASVKAAGDYGTPGRVVSPG